MPKSVKFDGPFYLVLVICQKVSWFEIFIQLLLNPHQLNLFSFILILNHFLQLNLITFNLQLDIILLYSLYLLFQLRQVLTHLQVYLLRIKLLIHLTWKVIPLQLFQRYQNLSHETLIFIIGRDIEYLIDYFKQILWGVDIWIYSIDFTLSINWHLRVSFSIESDNRF